MHQQWQNQFNNWRKHLMEIEIEVIKQYGSYTLRQSIYAYNFRIYQDILILLQ